MTYETLAPGVEIWQGDCLEVMRDIPDKSVDAVITDPPYGIDYQSARRSDKSQWKPKIANDKEPYTKWIGDVHRILKNTGCLYCFYRWDVQDEFYNAITPNMPIKSQIVWDKVIHGMGDLKGEYAPQHELIMFAIMPDFQFPGKRPRTIIKQRRVLPDDLLHPNEKPVALMAKLIRDCTNPGDTVADLFFGSGATGVACVQTGRNFIGIEIDPDYFKIARKRIKEALMQPRLL